MSYAVLTGKNFAIRIHFRITITGFKITKNLDSMKIHYSHKNSQSSKIIITTQIATLKIAGNELATIQRHNHSIPFSSTPQNHSAERKKERNNLFIKKKKKDQIHSKHKILHK